ncbi:MAG: protein kinase [Deltaproteobacteria bacterium]|nr:protein kinase [Deltaproteobacteria bacterium]
MAAPKITDKYELLRRLGKGGMAEVFLARQRGLEGFSKLVVLKRILPHKAQDGEFVTMFLDEARTAADLRHPNIVNVFDINRDLGTYYMAMEFLHGADVRGIMKRSASQREWIPTEQVLEIIMGAAEGLHYAHEKTDQHGQSLGIVHRDVSPQNIIVGFSGETKILDFGIAKCVHQQVHTEDGVIKGKFAYMSPEQVEGDPLDGRSDQFALGVVMWEMLTLRRLFKRGSEQATLMTIVEEDAPSIREARPDLPKSLAKIVDKVLSKRREDRYASCGDLRIALEDFLAEERMAHSSARLGKYMRELFSGDIDDEAALAKELLDENALKESADDKKKIESRKSKTVAEATRAVRSARKTAEPPTKEEAKSERRSKNRGEAEEDANQVTPGNELAEEARRELQDQRIRRLEQSQTKKPPPSYRKIFMAAAAVFSVMLLAAAAFGGAVWYSKQPKEGALIVRTKPRSARLSINGKDTGEITPHLLHPLVGDLVEVTVQKKGFVTEKRIVRISAGGETTEITIPLVPIGGKTSNNDTKKKALKGPQKKTRRGRRASSR